MGRKTKSGSSLYIGCPAGIVLALLVASGMVFMMGGHASAEITGSPVSHWPAEGNAYDAADGNHGTLYNGATFAAGEIGQGFLPGWCE